MRHAPPVQVPVGRFVWGAAMGAAALGLLGAAALGLNWWLSPPSWPQALGGALAWMLSALGCWGLLAHESLPPGELRWDGQGWTYQMLDGQTQTADVAVRLDLGAAMLVAVRLSQGPLPRCRYVGLRAAHMPGLWHLWRCAVYGRDIL